MAKGRLLDVEAEEGHPEIERARGQEGKAFSGQRLV